MSLQAYNSATDTLTPIAESDYKDSLEEISALPTASADLLNKCYLLTANQVGYVKGGIYQCQLVGASYEWVLVSQNPLEAGKGITIENDVISADTNVFNGTLDEWEALTADEQAQYTHIATPEEVDVTSGYSTTETKTGATWIDGKPIYRKVFTGLSYGSTSGDYRDVGVTITSIETLVGSTTIRSRAGAIDHLEDISIIATSSGVIQCLSRGAYSPAANILILEYTKTTD